MILIRIITLALVCTHIMASANQIDFMVLNMQGKKETEKRWKPLAQYLQQELSQEVRLLTTPNTGFLRRSSDKEILLTNPVSAVIIEDTGEFEIIATLNHIKQGSTFAGVIIVHKNSSIKNLQDLAGKKVGVVNLKFAAGGFLFQANELVEAGVDPNKDFKRFIEMSNQTAIVKRVMQNQLDAGFIRTGMLESLSEEIDVSQLRIINRKEDGLIYPRSTAIYPHWGLLVRKNMPEYFKQTLLNSLLKITADSEISTTVKMKGFVPAKDYASIKSIMKKLDVYQFKN